MKRTMMLALALSCLFLGIAATSARAAGTDDLTPAQWHEKERNGLGFGLVAGNGTGAHVYYDRNLSGQFQIHADVQSQSLVESNIFNAALVTTTKSAVTAALRYFPDAESGWFIGGGGGIGSVQQTYFLGGDTASQANFAPVFFDGGWQGWDGYYFTVSIQLGGAVDLGTTDKTGNIPSNFQHRSIAQRDLKDMRDGGANGILIGFGWYLK